MTPCHFPSLKKNIGKEKTNMYSTMYTKQPSRIRRMENLQQELSAGMKYKLETPIKTNEEK